VYENKRRHVQNATVHQMMIFIMDLLTGKLIALIMVTKLIKE